jgi:magnesium transporter
MLNYYIVNDGLLQPLDPAEHERRCKEVVWIDLHDPTLDEEHAVEALIGIDVPTREEMHEIEFSSRFYQDNGALYATATLLTHADSAMPQIHAISFVLCGTRLITVRYCDPLPFRLFIKRGGKMEAPSLTGNAALVGIMEAVVDRMADMLELASHRIDAIGHGIFRPGLVQKLEREEAQPDLEEMLRQIGVAGDGISKVRECLGNITRLLGYVSQTAFCKDGGDDYNRIQVMLRDIPGLNDHANFLTNKLSFLLDATLGMISIEQNAIIKIFSVAAVIFLPPTLVASVYGMNFLHMPELKWHYGYLLALGLMMLAGWLPYRYFKQRKWL